MRISRWNGSGAAWVAAGVWAAALSLMAEPPPAPLFNNLGNYQHAVTTRSPEAQRYFNQGLTLLYAFNHAEAIRSFTAVARLDPDCAMGWWGVACAHGPHVNSPMPDEAVPKAWEALQKAQALKEKASPRERAYIDALARRYSAAPVKDRAPLDQAYAEAMRDVARAYPDDLDASVLAAEAMMDTMPWDYWTPQDELKPPMREVQALLQTVLRRDPDHPGANHLYIHVMEAGPTPEVAIPAADRLGRFAPGAGHLVHMPSHIYVRVGEYDRAAQANIDASKSDESYISACRAQGFYPGVYYPHNVHFLWFARGLEGRSEDSIAAARKVAQYAIEGRCGVLEGPRLRHLPLLALARFGRWDEILQAPKPVEQKFDTAMWHYARGLALAARKDAEGAAREHEAFRAVAALDEIKAMDNPHLPATGILKVAERVLAAKVAGARGDQAGCLSQLRSALAAETELPYMEPPYWAMPVRQTLGAALLNAGQFAEAEKVFREDLRRLPRNGWSLQGLSLSLARQGNEASAASVQREFDRAWKNADVRLELAWY